MLRARGPAVLLGVAALPSAVRLIGDHDLPWPIMIVSFTPLAAVALVAVTAVAAALRRRVDGRRGRPARRAQRRVAGAAVGGRLPAGHGHAPRRDDREPAVRVGGRGDGRPVRPRARRRGPRAHRAHAGGRDRARRGRAWARCCRTRCCARGSRRTAAGCTRASRCARDRPSTACTPERARRSTRRAGRSSCGSSTRSGRAASPPRRTGPTTGRCRRTSTGSTPPSRRSCSATSTPRGTTRPSAGCSGTAGGTRPRWPGPASCGRGARGTGFRR